MPVPDAAPASHIRYKRESRGAFILSLRKNTTRTSGKKRKDLRGLVILMNSRKSFVQILEKLRPEEP